MPKKILFITHQLTRTGAPQVFLDMVLCCKRAGHNVLVISLADGEARGDWEKAGIDVTVMPQIAKIADQIIPIFKRFDHIVLNTLVCIDIIPVCITAGVKSIWWIHEHENYFEYYKNILLSEDELGNNVRVLGVSPVTLRLLREYAGYKRAELLPFCVPDSAVDIDTKIGDRTPKKFLCIGVYAFVKGQDILCAAIEKLPDEVRKQCCFEFYGDRNEVDAAVYEPLHLIEQKYVEVTICDAVPHKDMLKRIEEADYLIIPSRKEPMPTVAAEAMMLKTVCVISDICGVTEYLSDGINALFFRSEDADALSRRICDSVCIDAKDYKRMALAARKIYEEEFSEEVFSLRVRKLFEQ